MPQKPSTVSYPAIALVAVFTIASLVLCVQVEVLNARSRTPIPFKFPNNKQHLKWRLAWPSAIRGEWERRIAEYSERDMSVAERERLISEAQQKMAAELAATEIEHRFKSAVGWGLLTYLLVPTAVLLAFQTCRRSNSTPLVRVLALSIAINLKVGSMVWARGYFSALTQGW